jgi:hypothetical protein
MLGDIGFVSHTAESFTSGAFDFRSNFVGGLILSQASEAEARGVGFTDVMFGATLLLFLPGLLLAFGTGKTRFDRMFLALSSIFVLGFALATPLSLPLWDNVRLLQLIQFPWRALILVSLAAAMLTAFGFDALSSSWRTGLRPLAIGVIGLIIAGAVFTAAQVIRPANYIDPDEFDTSVSAFSTAKSCECWWPRWANAAVFSNPRNVSAGTRDVATFEWGPDRRTFVVAPGPTQDLVMRTFYHPNWRAVVNDLPAVTFHRPDGMAVELSERGSSVAFSFDEPLRNQVAVGVSATTWVVFVMIGLVTLMRRNRSVH